MARTHHLKTHYHRKAVTRAQLKVRTKLPTVLAKTNTTQKAHTQAERAKANTTTRQAPVPAGKANRKLSTCFPPPAKENRDLCAHPTSAGPTDQVSKLITWAVTELSQDQTPQPRPKPATTTSALHPRTKIARSQCAYHHPQSRSLHCPSNHLRTLTN